MHFLQLPERPEGLQSLYRVRRTSSISGQQTASSVKLVRWMSRLRAAKAKNSNRTRISARNPNYEKSLGSRSSRRHWPSADQLSRFTCRLGGDRAFSTESGISNYR